MAQLKGRLGPAVLMSKSKRGFMAKGNHLWLGLKFSCIL